MYSNFSWSIAASTEQNKTKAKALKNTEQNRTEQNRMEHTEKEREKKLGRNKTRRKSPIYGMDTDLLVSR